MPKIIFQPLMIANPPERLTEERAYPALLDIRHYGFYFLL